MQALLESIRKACLPGVWSQGVKLARDGAVTAGPATADELTFRVRAAGHAIALTVSLYLEGPEWTCDCEGKTDPCAHVAAAAIASAQAAERGESLATTAVVKPAHLEYRLSTKDRLLTVVRVLVHGDGREERLADSIASSVARGRVPEGWTPAHEDLHAERILGNPAREIVQPGRVRDSLRRAPERRPRHARRGRRAHLGRARAASCARRRRPRRGIPAAARS